MRRPHLLAVVLSFGLVVALLGACAPSNAAVVPTTTTVLPPAPSGHRPVVIVPGFAVSCFNGPVSEWEDWTDAFLRAGYAAGEVRVMEANRCVPVAETAAVIGNMVDSLLAATGQTEVDIVAHSMGAIGARWCVEFGSCAGRVASVTTLSGANHGTVWAGLCPLQSWSAACDDMRPDGPTLAALNTPDETPGEIHWETYVSWCELQILPAMSALLNGADNHFIDDRCVDHDGWKRDRSTIDSVVARLANTAP